MPILEHHLEQALADRLDVALARLADRQLAELAGRLQAAQRLQREVRVDGRRAVAEQQREVHATSRGSPRLDDEAAHRARALAHEVRVHGGRRQQRPRSARSSSSTPRSERIEDRGAVSRPPATACRHSCVQRALEPRRRPSRTGYSVRQRLRRGSPRGAGGGASPARRSCSTGCSIVTRRQCSGRSSSRLPIGADARRAGSSRAPRACGSIGGFVTWANCCLKYVASSFGRAPRGRRAARRRPSSRPAPRRRAPSARSGAAAPPSV